MTESEIIELAKKNGAKPSSRITKYELIFDDEQLLSFATEIRNRTLDEAIKYVDEQGMAGADRLRTVHALRKMKGDEK
jgi:hypothetical protein